MCLAIKIIDFWFSLDFAFSLTLQNYLKIVYFSDILHREKNYILKGGNDRVSKIIHPSVHSVKIPGIHYFSNLTTELKS